MRKVLILLLLVAVALPLPAAEKQKDLTFFLLERLFPHIAIGGVWSSTMILMNLDGVAADTRVEFFKPDGTPWQVTDAEGNTFSALDITLGALEMLIIELPSRGPDVETGWAQVEQPDNATIGGQLIFRDNGGVGRPIPFEAVVPLTNFLEGSENLLEDFWVMHAPFDQRPGFNTCLAIANPDEEVEVGIVPVDIEEGILAELATSILLPAGNQRAFCLNTELPELAGRRGYLTLGRDAGTSLGVLGLRFDQQGAFTTILPMSTL
jgi:hypothetical protein